MKRTVYILIFSALLSVPRLGAQVCLPQINPPSIDGLVATDPFHLVSGSVPNSDPGWATAPYKEFAVVGGGGAGTLKAAIFAGTVLAAGAPSDLFIGLHVEGADEFSSQDLATLYFDTNNDGQPDFALSYNIGPSTVVTNQTNPQHASSIPVTSVSLYVFSGGVWQPKLPLPASLQSLTSYNFTSSGTSNGIWELEIKIHLPDLYATPFNVPNASTTGMQFGAKLYSTSVTGTTPLDWPPGLITDLNPNDSGPGAGTGGDPIKMDMRSVNPSNNGCSGDVQLQANGLRSHARGTDDLFYLPKTTDFDSSGNLPATFQTQLIANTIYVNTGDQSDTSATGGTNTGNVHFFLMPWGAGPVATVDAGIAPIGFQQFGTAISASVNWPQTLAQWSPYSNDFLSLSNHTCLKVQLEGFIGDSDLTNDNPPQINLTYTTMSTHTDKFLIHAPGTFSPGAPKENYVMKVHWSNLAKGQAKDPEKHESCHRRFCDWVHHRKYWQASFVNSKSLGLKPLGNGSYGLKLAPGEEVTAEIELSGASMPVPSQTVHISPRAGGQVLTPASGEPVVVVPIIPGGMVTIVANGEISILQQDQASVAVPGSSLNNANGFPQPRLQSVKFLLSSKAFTPWQVAGALIGSFQPDFSDSFFIGTEGTFFAAPTATKLYLAVNDVAGGFSDNTGPGFDLNVVATPPTILPTRLSWPANAQLGLPGIPQPAANLPIVAVDVMRVDPATKAILPIGYVAYATYATHEGNTGKGAGTDGGKLQ